MFDGKQVKQLTTELGLTKSELSGFIAKSTDTLDSLERMLHRESGTSATYATLVRDFNKIGDPYHNNIFVRKSVDKIAGSIAGVDIAITSEKGVDLPDSNPAQQLFQYINDEDSQFDFFYEVIRSLTRYGSAHILLSDETRGDGKTPQTMEILQALKMVAQTNKGMLTGWEYNGKTRFTKEQILFIRYKHPEKPYVGLAPGSAAIKEILQDFYAQTYNIKNFQNGAMGKGTWVDPNGSALSPAQKAEAQFAVDNEFNKGVDGAGSTTVMARKLDWVRTSESNRDLEFTVLLNKMRDDILVAYDIPKVLFTSADATFTNLKEAKKLFWAQTLLPIIKKVKDAFSTNFFMARKIPGELSFKVDTIPELQNDVAEKMISAQAMYNMNIPISVINEVLDLGLPEEGWDGWDEKPQATFAFDTESDTTKEVVLDPVEIINTYKKQVAWDKEKSLAYDEFALEMEFNKSLQVLLSNEKKMSNLVVAFYIKVYKEQIEPQMEKILLDKSVKDDLISTIKTLDLSDAFFAAMRDQVEDVYNQGVYRTYNGVAADFQLRPDRTLAYLAERNLKLAKSPDVVKQAIVDMLEKETFTIDEMATAISKKWKDVSISRAKAIAVTETTVAYSAGRVKGMKELGIKNKKWIHSHDSSVRDSHRISETVGVDEQYTLADGEKVTGPGNGSAKNAINCRCVVISVLE